MRDLKNKIRRVDLILDRGESNCQLTTQAMVLFNPTTSFLELHFRLSPFYFTPEYHTL